MKKNNLSTMAVCSTFVLLTACGGGKTEVTNTPPAAEESSELTWESLQDADILDVLADINSDTTDTVAPGGKTYDLGRYILTQQAGTTTRNRYRDEDGSLTSFEPISVQVDAPMQEGVWIEDTLGFRDTIMITKYRVNAQDINIMIQTGKEPLAVENQINLNRFVSIGQDAFIDPELGDVNDIQVDEAFDGASNLLSNIDAAIDLSEKQLDASVLLKAHHDSFDSSVAGDYMRTDSDVISLDISLELLDISSELVLNLGNGLGTVSGVDRNCIKKVLFIDTVNDSLADEECDSIRTDYIILD